MCRERKREGWEWGWAEEGHSEGVEGPYPAKGREASVEWSGPAGGVCANGEAAALSTPPSLARPFRCCPSKPPLSLASLAQLHSPPRLLALPGQQSPTREPTICRKRVRTPSQLWQPPPWPPLGARPPPPWPRPPSSTSQCVTALRRWRPPSACAPRPLASAAASRTASRASWTLERPRPSCSPPPPFSPMYVFTLLLLTSIWVFCLPRIWMG